MAEQTTGREACLTQHDDRGISGVRLDTQGIDRGGLELPVVDEKLDNLVIPGTSTLLQPPHRSADFLQADGGSFLVLLSPVDDHLSLTEKLSLPAWCRHGTLPSAPCRHPTARIEIHSAQPQMCVLIRWSTPPLSGRLPFLAFFVSFFQVSLFLFRFFFLFLLLLLRTSRQPLPEVADVAGIELLRIRQFADVIDPAVAFAEIENCLRGRLSDPRDPGQVFLRGFVDIESFMPGHVWFLSNPATRTRSFRSISHLVQRTMPHHIAGVYDGRHAGRAEGNAAIACAEPSGAPPEGI